MEPTPPRTTPSPSDGARRAMLAATIVCVASIAAFFVVTRASFTAQLQLQYEADLDYVRGVNFVDHPNPFGQGPEIGFGTDLTLDHGPAFYALMAPFVAAIPSPMALVALQATLFGVGLAALGVFAHRRVGLLGATLAVLIWLSSSAAFSEWEDNLWHCSALPGLLVLHFALAERFWRHPTGASLFTFLASGSLAVQVYSAAAGIVLPALGLTAVALWRRRVRAWPAAAAMAMALVVSMPLLVRLAVVLPVARFVDTPDVTQAFSETLNDAARAVTALAQPGWTVFAGRLPSAIIVGVGVVLLLVVPVWRRGRERQDVTTGDRSRTFGSYLLVTGLLVCATGAWAYRERAQERYLIAVFPTLLVLAVEGGGAFLEALRAWRAADGHVQTGGVAGAAIRYASPSFAVVLALAPWLPATTGGIRDRALLPPPGDTRRVGNDFRLGLGETIVVLQWLHETTGIGWPDTCSRVHGRFCQPAGGVPGTAVTHFITSPERRSSDHVVMLVDGSGARCPTDRLVSETHFTGAYGRRITACRFRPAILASDALFESKQPGSAPYRLCKAGLPLDATWNSWGPEARDASNLWPGDNRQFRDDDPCPGGSHRAFIPLSHAAGTVAVELTLEGNHDVLSATVTHLGSEPSLTSELELSPTADGGAVVGTVSWTSPTRGLLITFDVPDPIIRFDVY